MSLVLRSIHHLGSLYRGVLFFFFNDTATTEIYTLSLHDALPISSGAACPRTSSRSRRRASRRDTATRRPSPTSPDRKSTRLNSSHSQISYAVFCLKKKKTEEGNMHLSAVMIKLPCATHLTLRPNQ